MDRLISQQAAIDYCYKLINMEHQQGSDEMNYGQERVNQTETILHHLESMPSAQPTTTGMICGSCKYSDGTALYTTAKFRCKRSGELHFVTDYCNLPPTQPEKRTETHVCDSINGQGAIDTEGLDVQIRCEMCRNPMHTDRGCDGNCKYDEKLYERIMQILGERIKPLSSAQPEQRWIPCSERLPEEGYVLISKMPTKISGDKWSVTIAIRVADQRSRKIQWRDIGFGVIQDDKVLAWKHLPESYKGE